MKSLVLCEPSYGSQSKDDRTLEKSNKTDAKNIETTVKQNDSLSDIEICEVIGNAVNGGENTDMRKNESNTGEEEGEEEEEETSPDGEPADGVGDDVSEDDKDIEILSCSLKKEEGVSENRKISKEVLEKSNDTSMEVSEWLSDCVDNSTEQENSASHTESTADSSGPCTTENELVEEVSEMNDEGQANVDDSERDSIILEENSGRVSSDSEVAQGKTIGGEKVDDEFDAEETERGKQSSDEGFIEEEENKENRESDEGATDGDVRKEDSSTPVVESTWGTDENSTWNGEAATEFYVESNGDEDSEIHADEMETSDCEKGGKSVECDSAEEAVKVEPCLDVNKEEVEEEDKTVEEVFHKRKRLSVDDGESSSKKRRTEGNETAAGKVKRRHSHDATFREDESNESCHDSGDDKKEVEKEEMEDGACKKNALEESIDRVASGRVSLPFLESLRGTIKTLSRSDLEELIVQKLCEVITERSTVGDLRKKAQALEQDQERWKDKVQSLTKQLREMDMVMKKYMSEVQKQNKERNFQMVTPLRVTRSVGLQVSFGAANSKQSKVVPNNNQARQSVLQSPEKIVKPTVQIPVNISSNTKKNLPVLQCTQSKKLIGKDLKKPFSPRVGVNVTFQTRLLSPQTAVASNRTLQTQQMNTVNRPRMPVTDQSSSKIIDLTEDDDRQNSQTTAKTVLQSSVTVRPPGQIRVVNHIQPTQVNSGGRVAYLVPATTAASGSTGSSQSRQLLIATPTVPSPPRQILPSVPPLFYKGSTILQPGAQQPHQPQQSHRALLAKKFKHPAPLPQPPPNRVHKPNLKLLPPRPALKISKVQTGIVLSWNMTLGPEYEPIASYQLYAYQENSNPPSTSLWKKVGDVKALPLPMACTLTQFVSGHKYYFAVRAVDLHSRIGPFSFPGSIVLIK